MAGEMAPMAQPHVDLLGRDCLLRFVLQLPLQRRNVRRHPVRELCTVRAPKSLEAQFNLSGNSSSLEQLQQAKL